MAPDEVIRALSGLGIKVSRATLQRWTRASLIPEPVTGSHGRGRGRFTDYPEETPFEAAATWWVLHYPGLRPSVQAVRAARRESLEMHQQLTTPPETEPSFGGMGAPRLHVAWLVAKTKAREGWPLDRPSRVRYRWTVTGTPASGDLKFEFMGIELREAEEDTVSLDLRRVDL